MKEQIEIEYKILISEHIFKQIIEDYQNRIENDYIQINHYLTHPILQAKKYMLRIREKNNQYELTLKRPYQNHRLETNVDFSSKDKDRILNHQKIDNEIINILNQEGIPQEKLENQFSLTTHRYDIPLQYGLLSIDENTYLNQKDYEIEFEVTDEEKGFKQFLEIIQPYSLNYTKNCPSKIKRVLDHL